MQRKKIISSKRDIKSQKIAHEELSKAKMNGSTHFNSVS